MEKNMVVSFICLGIYTLLFLLIVNHVTFGSYGKLVIISMCISPLIGILFGLKSRNRPSKWLVIILNSLALFTIIYLLVLGFGMGEA
ncbi:hypothetical protein ACFSCX_07240 [Bacillus salitolerans]|uniref:Uncharacterized protein n=1 Tax=Bacillus salitolerans TaxID=1437434 RepID=A0ABW4LN73_9BACI